MRAFLNSLPLSLVILLPHILISPDFIFSKRTTDLPRVDFPQPDSPTKPNITEFNNKQCRFVNRCPKKMNICSQCEPRILNINNSKVRCHLFND